MAGYIGLCFGGREKIVKGNWGSEETNGKRKERVREEWENMNV